MLDLFGVFGASFIVTNNGPDDAPNVTADFSGSAAGNTLASPCVVIVGLFEPCGTLAAGESVTVLAGGLAVDGDSLILTVASDVDDPDTANNSATQEFIALCNFFCDD